MKGAATFTLEEPFVGESGELRRVARRIFTATFGHLYPTDPFQAYCDRIYGEGGAMDLALRDPLVRWRTAKDLDGAIIGYAKLAPLAAPAPAPKPGAMELQQIYVLPDWHGRGVAQALMDWGIEAATKAGAPELYLTVFDHNERAKSFYARNGFGEVGHCTFTLGDRVDDDRVWCRPLPLGSA